MSISKDDDIWERMLLWVSERTGLSTYQINRIFEISEDYWEEHIELAKGFMDGDDQ